MIDTTTRKLTDRQREVLEFVACYIDEKGYAPTLTEIAVGLDFKFHSGAAGQLAALSNWGMIERAPGRARALSVTSLGRSILAEAKAA